MTMSTAIAGRVWKFGDNVCGDDGIIEYSIVREGFGKPFNPELLRSVCFRKLRPEFPDTVREGDIVVGGTNFAHHNHIEVAAAIRFSGIAAVLVESCESGFIRRALTVGLPVLHCPGITAAVEDGERVTVDPASGRVWLPGGEEISFRPFTERMVATWQAGGVVPYLQQVFARAGQPQ